MELQHLKALLGEDLSAVQQGIQTELDESLDYVRQVRQAFLSASGKQIRPLLLQLCARAHGLPAGDPAMIEQCVALEMIHAATLLHDDVIDEADQRRGLPSGNYMLGNAGSILVGDFLYSRAFQIMVRRGHLSAVRLLADTTNRIARGELLQLMNKHNPFVTPEQYFDTIAAKTACLFSAAAQLGALLAGADSLQQQAMADFGHQFGLVFQLVDDQFDYVQDTALIGKAVGHDLSEGRATLPVIWAIMHCQDEDRTRLCEAVQGAPYEWESVRKVVTQAGGLDHAQRCAQDHAQLAQQHLQRLPKSDWKDALEQLSYFALTRTS